MEIKIRSPACKLTNEEQTRTRIGGRQEGRGHSRKIETTRFHMQGGRSLYKAELARVDHE